MIKDKTLTRKKRPPVISTALCAVLVLAAFLCFYAAKWYVSVYGRMGFDSVLYTLFNNLGGVQIGLVTSFLGAVLPPALCGTALVCFILFFRSKKKIVLTLFGKLRIHLLPMRRAISIVICLAASMGLILHAAVDVDLLDYLESLSHASTLFEDEYRDPDNVQITFPEQKRNLIYIFMESMETTFFSQEDGGALEYNAIPELYTLAQNNINFSHSNDVGGFGYAPGTNWTVAAMVAQTSGVPLKTPPGIDGNSYGQDGVFLPGLTTLGDILHENGYYQTLMVGSDSSFGGRYQYYTQHHTDMVYDVYTAREDGIIPEDYYAWWGMEDKYLYEYAKQELTSIAQQDQPFAFSMLTVDTHHIGGYVCEYCENTHAEQYENVYSCASRQLNEFVEWLQQQDFYENTTIVIAGDHPSMDSGYIERRVGDYSRKVYNCFINAAAEPVSQTYRIFSPMDMFPTTLAAMGCQIEGDRLGLGTNLFSELPTLAEELGYQPFCEALKNSSIYYAQNFYFIN